MALDHSKNHKMKTNQLREHELLSGYFFMRDNEIENCTRKQIKLNN